MAESHERSRVEIRFSGSGGQGILLAAALSGRRPHRERQGSRADPKLRSRGPRRCLQGRGHRLRRARSTIPRWQALTSRSVSRRPPSTSTPLRLRPGGLVVFDEKLVRAEADPGRAPGRPALRRARPAGARQGRSGQRHRRRRFGRAQRLASPEALQEALRRRLPAKILELNLRALEVGRVAAQRARRAGRCLGRWTSSSIRARNFLRGRPCGAALASCPQRRGGRAPGRRGRLPSGRQGPGAERWSRQGGRRAARALTQTSCTPPPQRFWR